MNGSSDQLSNDSFGRTLAEEILARAVDDWVSDAEVIGLVRRFGVVKPEDCRDIAIGLISRLVIQGMVVAGDIVDGRHHPWNMQKGDTVVCLTWEWLGRSDPFVMPGEILWLDATRSGQAAGEEIWRREADGR